MTFQLTPAVADASAALARLFGGIYRPAPDTAGMPLADAELARRLAAPVPADIALADWASVRLEPGAALSAWQHGVLATSEAVTHTFLAAPAFHPLLAATLGNARGLFAAAALPADGWLANPQHPLRAVLAECYQLACGWHPELGAAATATREQLGQWLAAVPRSERDWSAVLADIRQWRQQDEARRARLEQRLREAEAGALRARRARQLAARLLNQAMGDRQLPAAVVTALREDWFTAMQQALLQDGEQGQAWQRARRLTGTLRWTLQPEGEGDEARNRLYRLVAQASEELESLAALLLGDAMARERLVAACDEAHGAAVRGLAIPRVPFAPVDADDALADGRTEVSQVLLAPVLALAPGQWFRQAQAAGERRLRLLVRDDDNRQLLFGNALGARAAQASVEAFALQLAGGDTLALPPTADLDGVLAREHQALQQRFDSLQQSRLDSLREARARAAAEARARELARQKALAEAQALETVRQEAAHQAALLQQAADAGERDEAARRRQRARLVASSLPLGSWLDFHAEDGSSVRRRLTVVLPSSGKYILVDTEGNGRYEVARDELVEGLASGRIVPLERSQRMDDALSRVIAGSKPGEGNT